MAPSLLGCSIGMHAVRSRAPASVVAPAVPALRPLGVPERVVHGKSVLRGSQFPRNRRGWPGLSRMHRRGRGILIWALRLAGGSIAPSVRPAGLSVWSSCKDVVVVIVANVPASRGLYYITRSRAILSRVTNGFRLGGRDATGAMIGFSSGLDRPRRIVYVCVFSWQK
jgi:hypothetical protein